jgi:hypothetical protein
MARPNSNVTCRVMVTFSGRLCSLVLLIALHNKPPKSIETSRGHIKMG